MRNAIIIFAVILALNYVYADHYNGYCATICHDCKSEERSNCYLCCDYGYPFQCFSGWQACSEYPSEVEGEVVQEKITLKFLGTTEDNTEEKGGSIEELLRK